MLTTEKKILLPLRPGLEPESFRSRVRRCTTELSQLPPFSLPTWSHLVLCLSATLSPIYLCLCLSVCLSLSISPLFLTRLSPPPPLYYPRLSLRHFFSPSVQCIYADRGAIGHMMSDTYPAMRLLGKELSHQRGKEFNKWMKIWHIIMDVEGQHRRPNSGQNSP